MKKKEIIITLLVVLGIVLLVVGYIFGKKAYKNFKTEKEEFGIEIYNKVREFYFSGRTIKYVYDDKHERVYALVDEKDKYYQIDNYEEVFKDVFAESFINKVNEFFEIKEIDGNYYIKDFGRGNSNYLETTLEMRKYKKNKIEYTAITKICKQYKIGNNCKESYAYTYPFVIIKEDNKWKVSEYTSIFQFK